MNFLILFLLDPPRRLRLELLENIQIASPDNSGDRRNRSEGQQDNLEIQATNSNYMMKLTITLTCFYFKIESWEGLKFISS